VRRPGDEDRVRGPGSGPKKVTPTTSWPQWRGPNRDGRVGWLPAKLPAAAAAVWEAGVNGPGLGGIAATAEHVIYSDRELNDTIDLFRCLNAADGKERWSVRVPAVGMLDYGNSSRATPLVQGDLVFLSGAFGDLTCVELATGKMKWQTNVRDEFDATDDRKWGTCSSPLIADGKLIVNPGAKTASLVALDPPTGKVVWKSPGKPASYGSFIAATLGGNRQIVGYDTDTLGGWDPATGTRLWTLKPDRPSDFNVPTPIAVGERLLISTENNGTRLYGFKPDGTIDPKPAAANKHLAPDTSTPVVVGNRVFGVWNRFYCLDLTNGLKAIYDEPGQAFSGYCALVASADRVLVIARTGELILLDASTDEYTERGRVAPFPKTEVGVFSHPAFVGTRIYLRGSTTLVCLDLGP
jgi:outer membrane protein assembly factor BamB